MTSEGNVRVGLKYTKDHEWILVSGDSCRVGISDYAQHELGDVVYVDLPQVGKVVKQGQSVLSVESVKAVSDVYAPVSGKVSAVNEKLAEHPELINNEPYDGGWIVELAETELSEVEKLLSSEDYTTLISELSR